MKKSRKILAMLMAIAMTATMLVGLTASAEADGSITITSQSDGLSLEGQIFRAFRIFDVKYNGDKFAYKIVDAFKDFDDYDDSGNQTLLEYLTSLAGQDNSDEVNEVAAALWAYILDEDLINLVLDPSDPEFRYVEIGGTGLSVVFDNLPLGYYLIYNTGFVTDTYRPINGDDPIDNTTPPFKPNVIGSCILTTTKPDAEVCIKADAPTLDKWIWNRHPEINDWVRWNDVSIGDEVEFMLETNVPNTFGYSKYTFNVHDKMGDGLTFKFKDEDDDDFEPVEIYLYGTREKYEDELEIIKTNPSFEPTVVKLSPTTGILKYTLNYPLTPVAGHDCTFDIEFDKEDMAKLGDPKTILKPKTNPGDPDEFYGPGESFDLPIYIYYSATLNDKAIIEAPGNENKARLEYSRYPYWKGDGTDDEEETNVTPWRRVLVYTGWLGFFKYELVENEYIALADAKFKMYNAENKLIRFEKVTLPTYPTRLGSDSDTDWDAKVNTWLAAVRVLLKFRDFDPEYFLDESPYYEYSPELLKDANIYIVTEGGSIDELVTPENGIVLIIGLGASYELSSDGKGHVSKLTGTGLLYDDFGDYWLEETEVPDGFYILEDRIPVQLRIGGVDFDPDFDANIPGYDDPEWKRYGESTTAGGGLVDLGTLLKIQNTAGPKFPDTGGAGRRMFIIGGVALMAFAVVGLIIFTARKKKKIVVE